MLDRASSNYWPLHKLNNAINFLYSNIMLELGNRTSNTPYSHKYASQAQPCMTLSEISLKVYILTGERSVILMLQLASTATVACSAQC